MSKAVPRASIARAVGPRGPQPGREPSRRAVARAVTNVAGIAIGCGLLAGSMVGSTAAAAASLAKAGLVAAQGRSAPATALRPPPVPYAGAYVGADPNPSKDVPTVVEAASLSRTIHRPLAIVSIYEAWTSSPPVSEMRQLAAAGAVPMISVHCGTADSAVAAGADDAMLRDFAATLKDYGGPVFFRWFWEMNLTKNANHPQCLGAGTLATQGAGYGAAFRHIWKVFRDVGATNVAFVWAPSAALHVPDAAPFYPGNAYTDWIASDLYDRPGYSSWSTMYAPFYSEWDRTGKPLMLSETGAVGAASQASWLSNIHETAPTRFPDLHAVVYVDATDLSDYRLVPGTSGMAAFVALGAEAYFSMAGPEDGYITATAGGGVQNLGCLFLGSLAGRPIPAPIVNLVETPDGHGYWLVGSDGSVYPFGSARYYGSMRGKRLNEPIRGIAATADGRGYWMVASDGGIFSFGDARFLGSMGHRHLNRPIVGLAVGPGGSGYWLVASDGGIFAFGTAKFHGSSGAIRLNKPIVGMAASPSGQGYWLVASDGGVFTYGDSGYHGSLAQLHPGSVATGIAADPHTGHYRIVTGSGLVYQFPEGSQLALSQPPGRVVGIATVN